MKEIVLASSSPRRRELLEKSGLKFKVEPSDYEEEIEVQLDPHELVKLLSLKKAQNVAKKYEKAVVIAADTVVVLDDQIIGKPQSCKEARVTLEKLSGRSHLVITGFTIIDIEKDQIASKSVETTVYFRELSSEEIEAYIESGEPLGKAGSYAIQGLASSFVEKVDGDFSNVVGLPLGELAQELEGFGVKTLQDF